TNEIGVFYLAHVQFLTRTGAERSRLLSSIVADALSRTL
ncbi:MAG: hypothetical protein ACI9BW_002567, partial [Gammaproteobacteria bacterium]